MKSRHFLYGIADIHLFPEARWGVRLPLSFTICTPVRFRNHPEERWSLWIVPEEPLFVCSWGRAKVAVLFDEQAFRLLKNAEGFDIWFGGVLGGEGIVREVRECDEAFYEQTFRFGDWWNEQ